MRDEYMSISKLDVILLSLDAFLSMPDGCRVFDRRTFLAALDLSEGSFRVYMSRLYKQGLMERKEGACGRCILRRVRILPKGVKRIEDVRAELSKCLLDPKGDLVGSGAPLWDLYCSMEDPYERTFLLSTFASEQHSDLPHLMKDPRLRKGCRIGEASFGRGTRTERLSLRKGILSMTVYGKGSVDGEVGQEEDVIGHLLSLADHSKCQGRLGEAERIFRLVLSRGDGLTHDQWFLANIGLVDTYRKGSDLGKALDHLSSLEGATDDPLHRGFICISRGNILTLKRDLGASIESLSIALNILKNLRDPMLLSMAYRGRGLAYHLSGKVKMAERDWKSSLRYARLSGNRYSEAGAMVDLAAVALSRNDLKRSAQLLRRAERTYWEVGDTDGLSWVESKWALFHLQRGETDRARTHHRKAFEINYPLPFDAERRMIGEILERFSPNRSLHCHHNP